MCRYSAPTLLQSLDGLVAKRHVHLVESKPTIEQFMNDFFRERTVSLKMILDIRSSYRRSFYHSECLWDSRRGVVDNSESEKIVSVSSSDIGAAVVTTGSQRNHRSRYRIKSSGESWLIQEVDTECGRCSVLGSTAECAECGGTGWRSWKDRSKGLEQRAAQRTRSSSDRELENRPFRDAAIEHFMSDHFRERTAIRKKEIEIYGDFAKRFFSPECDWERWTVKGSEADTIVNVILVDAGAQVIPQCFIRWQLRYNLRPVGQSWLIWDVDTECPLCYLEGRSADCFWCGGTIWERKKNKRVPTRVGPDEEGSFPRKSAVSTVKSADRTQSSMS